MQDYQNPVPIAPERIAWNKGKLIGAKPPLRPKHVWSIRTKLQIQGRTRDLAMFARRDSSLGAVTGNGKPAPGRKDAEALQVVLGLAFCTFLNGKYRAFTMAVLIRSTNMALLSNLATRDIETLLHPYTNLAALRETGPLVIERGKGIHVYDRAGKAYIVGIAGAWCTALGYGNEELVEAATQQMRNLSFGHLFGGKSHEPAIALAEKLKEIAPVPTSKVFFCNSGSEANDSTIKLLWYLNNALGRPKKKKIVSRLRAYHGATVASASLTALPASHRDFDLPIHAILHTRSPHHYRFAREGESEEDFASRLAAELEEVILREGPNTVAAFIAEPGMGAGGVIVPPATYFDKIAAVCAKYAVYMISDEVICGFGRLGSMFGCNALGFRPQAVTVGKALTSAYVPM